jgi:S-adenosyl-L-methionine hydrolase (adenosine-forming)
MNTNRGKRAAIKQPVITLLTDFGCSDHYVGAMKGVILGICPGARLVDISHEITPYEITEAAYTLLQAWGCFPKGTIHLVVVDPGVGSSRRPILAEAGGHRFVAPDNGVLTMVFDSVSNARVREIAAARYFREPVSRTFHGRDIFAPVAAHLAAGVAPSGFGRRIEEFVRLDFSKPRSTAPGSWTGVILKVDRFGNLITNFESAVWSRIGGQKFQMRIGAHRVSTMASDYAGMKAGHLFSIAGSAGFLEISMNRGSAAARLGVGAGEKVELFL